METSGFVSARASCRVDLAGGTLDIWPLGLLHPEARTLCVALDRFVTVRLTPLRKGYRVAQGGSVHNAFSLRELSESQETALIGHLGQALALPPMGIELHSDSPRGGGLGASSAMAVAMIAAAEEILDLPRSSDEEKAALARDVEARLMRLPTGTQDHYAALLGGVVELSYPPGKVCVRRLELELSSLEASLIVVYSGQSHFSAGNNWEVIRRRLSGESQMEELFSGIAATAGELRAALDAGDIQRVGSLMTQEWSFRRQLAPEVSTPVVEALLERTLSLGAWGGKVCGAGGGGCLAFLAPPENRERIQKELEEGGAVVLRTGICQSKLTVTRKR